MLGSEIYYNFKDNINWISEQVREDVDNLPPSLKKMGRRITSERLIFVPNQNHLDIDPEFPRPVPYTVFWFADALGYSDWRAINSFALSMVYSTIVSTLRDDIADNKELKKERTKLFILSNIFQRKYFEIFEKAFEKHSSFWRYLAQALDEQLIYESWNRTFTIEECQNPLSEYYIENSSRYFAAVVMPSLAAVAVASNSENRMNEIDKFVRHLSMGSRVHDDIRDCQSDLYVDDLNQSCILLYARQCLGRKNKLDEGDLVNLFLSRSFVKKVHMPVLLYFKKAKKDILAFNSPYLVKFMDEELSFIIRTRDAMLKYHSEFYNRLEALLKPLL